MNVPRQLRKQQHCVILASGCPWGAKLHLGPYKYADKKSERLMELSLVFAEDLHYSYPDGTPALKGVHFACGMGESVAVVGANGSGKSTLLMHLCGLLMPSRGRVLINGRPPGVSQSTPGSSPFGLVFQNSDDQLFMHIIGDDVAFGAYNVGLRGEKLAARVADSLKQVQLAPEDFLLRHTQHLSMGEKKRACIAGVLAMSPDVLAFDEPTVSLDPSTRRRLIALMKELTQTKLVATHDLDFALETCDRTVVLWQGKVVAEGVTRVILSDAALLDNFGLELPLSLLG